MCLLQAKRTWAWECPKKEGRAPKYLTLKDDGQGNQGSDPLSEPRVTLMVEGTPVDFLIDTGAEHSVLKHPPREIKK